MLLYEKDVRIVLVRPRNPLNIGAAARAMLNFGFRDLVVVAPHEPVWQESKAAVGAQAVLRQARVAPNLLSAVEDRTLVLGTSSFSRRQIPEQVISLEQLPAVFKKGRTQFRIAVVFGSEKTGLSNEDLSFCHWIVRIPTTDVCPSMNLGQAVSVLCYQLKLLMSAQASSKKYPSAAVAPVGEIERVANEIEKLVMSIPQPRRSAVSTRKLRLRQMLLRWGMTSDEARIVLGILHDLSWQLHRE